MCDPSFDAWFAARTGKSLKAMEREAFYSGNGKRMRAYRELEEASRRLYGYWLKGLEDWQAYLEHPDINTFVKALSGHTFGELHDLALATGSYRDYEKLCAWYRKHYELLHDNPFLSAEDVTIEMLRMYRMRMHPGMEEKRL